MAAVDDPGQLDFGCKDVELGDVRQRSRVWGCRLEFVVDYALWRGTALMMQTEDVIKATAEDAAAVRAHMRKAISIISGKWKLEVLWLLFHRIYRFNELRRAIPDGYPAHAHRAIAGA